MRPCDHVAGASTSMFLHQPILLCSNETEPHLNRNPFICVGPYCLNFVPQYSRQSLDSACSLAPTTKSILATLQTPLHSSLPMWDLYLSHWERMAVTIVGVTWVVSAFTTFKRKHDDSVWKLLHPTSLGKES